MLLIAIEQKTKEILICVGAKVDLATIMMIKMNIKDTEHNQSFMLLGIIIFSDHHRVLMLNVCLKQMP